MENLRLRRLRRYAPDGTGGAGSVSFAQDGIGTGAGGGSAAASLNGTDGGRLGSEENVAETSKIFSQTELDRVVSDRLKRERAKWEKETETKLSAAKAEAERMAAMTAEQRADALRQRQEQELAQREADITRRELRAQALETLAQKALPRELAELLDYRDAESCGESIASVEKAFKQAVETTVNDRLRGGSPPKFATPNGKTQTVAQEFGAALGG